MLCRAMRGVPTGPPIHHPDWRAAISRASSETCGDLQRVHSHIAILTYRLSKVARDKGNDGALSASIARGRSPSRQRQLVMTNRQRPAQTTCLRCCNFGFSAVLPVFTIASHLDLSEARSLMRCWRIRTGHRADRLGWLSDRVLPDLRLQVGPGLNPAPSSLKF
jgi:hypothetical protein